jgi:hypothetical protein
MQQVRKEVTEGLSRPLLGEEALLCALNGVQNRSDAGAIGHRDLRWKLGKKLNGCAAVLPLWLSIGSRCPAP